MKRTVKIYTPKIVPKPGGGCTLHYSKDRCEEITTKEFERRQAEHYPKLKRK